MPPHDVYIETHLGGGNILERKKPAERSFGMHDGRYIGGTFRERERIKRKQQRWRARLAKLPAVEREVMLEILNELASLDDAMVAMGASTRIEQGLSSRDDRETRQDALYRAWKADGSPPGPVCER